MIDLRTPWLLVWAGGTLGAFGRAVLDLVVFPGWVGLGVFPLSTTLVNLLGAFLLGFLTARYQALVARGLVEALDGGTPVRPRGLDYAQRRTLWGTGFCGSFTTYGTVSVTAAQAAGSGIVSVAAWTLVLLGAGVACAALGFSAAWKLYGWLYVRPAAQAPAHDQEGQA